jgi:nucleoside-diphosphate-sugar epimerase
LVLVDFVKPAREGTLNLLRSATTSPSPVKRVVYTSSTSAISRYPLTSPHTIFSEEDWGRDPEILEEQGNKASGFVKYRASKTLAERAAWEYYRESNEKKGSEEGAGWDLVVLNPPFVLGVRPAFHCLHEPRY